MSLSGDRIKKKEYHMAPDQRGEKPTKVHEKKPLRNVKHKRGEENISGGKGVTKKTIYGGSRKDCKTAFTPKRNVTIF